jgi:hypothetical protein
LDIEQQVKTFLGAINKPGNERRDAYYVFINDFIETYNKIPKKDPLLSSLEKKVISDFKNSLSVFIRFDSKKKSPEDLRLLVGYTKDKLQIVLEEKIKPMLSSPMLLNASQYKRKDEYKA